MKGLNLFPFCASEILFYILFYWWFSSQPLHLAMCPWARNGCICAQTEQVALKWSSLFELSSLVKVYGEENYLIHYVKSLFSLLFIYLSCSHRCYYQSIYHLP